MEDVSSLFDRNTMVLHGMSALFLQFLHPGVAQTLVQSGALERDPLARLRRTGELTKALLQSKPDAKRRFGVIHVGIDPEQILWVLTTLVITDIDAHALLYGPLTADRAEDLYDAIRPFAADVGITDELLPPTYEALRAYYWGMVRSLEFADGELQSTRDALALANAIFTIRVLGLRPVWLIKAFAAGLLPEEGRAVYRLRWGVSQRLFWRVVVALLRLRPPRPGVTSPPEEKCGG